jgi:hypothetical protein
MRRLAVLFAVVLSACTTSAFAASLSVTTWHLWSGSQSLTKGTCTLTGAVQTTDTYADEATNGDNSGMATIRVKAQSGSQQWSFVRFDFASCGIPSTGGADSATLNLRIVTAPNQSRTIAVTPVLSSWSGATLSTWAGTNLTYGSTTGTFTTGTVDGVTKSITVTDDVDAAIKGANWGWRLTDTAASNRTTIFGAASNGTASNRPTLVINYEK